MPLHWLWCVRALARSYNWYAQLLHVQGQLPGGAHPHAMQSLQAIVSLRNL